MKSTLAILALMLGMFVASPAKASIHFEGFEDPSWVANQTDNWQNYAGGTIARATSGTNGITSANGAAHAILTAGNGPFTRFGGYSNSFNGGFTTSLSVYLDPTTWTDGMGFDFSSAVNDQSGAHRRDFIWHIGMVGGSLLVNGSNNTDGAFNSYKLLNENGGNYHTVASAGWYTLQSVFYDNAGALAVDYNLLDSSSSSVYSITRSSASDLTSTVVGGNRYGWFTYNNIDNLAIDDTMLSGAAVPEPTAIFVWSSLAGLLGLVSFRRQRPV